MLRQYLLALVIAATVPGLALAAQQSAAAQTQSPAPPVAITPAIPNANGSAQPEPQRSQPPLAQQLSRSNGTIRPPAVDPGMDKMPPATRSTMPVLKPPPAVQSK